MSELRMFRLLAYCYIMMGMAILAWEMGKTRHELARGFTLLLVGVGVNSAVWLCMLALSMLDLNVNSMFTEWVRVANIAFLAIITTLLLVIFGRMNRLE